MSKEIIQASANGRPCFPMPVRQAALKAAMASSGTTLSPSVGGMWVCLIMVVPTIPINSNRFENMFAHVCPFRCPFGEYTL
jgi:hypothetical protein